MGGPCGRWRRWGARGGRSSGSSSARTGGPGPCRGRVGEVQGRSGPSARAIWALRLPISPGSIFLGARRARWGMRLAAGAQVVAILTGWFHAQAPVLLRTEGGPLTLRAAAGPPVTML